MRITYFLKHQNTTSATLIVDVDNGTIDFFDPINREMLPFLGHADLSLIRTWWDNRAVPSTRDAMKEVIRRAGAKNPEAYLAKNLALSMNDTYWICPVDEQINWEDVCFKTQKDINNGLLPYHNSNSYDPNASLVGQMEKYWDLKPDRPVLYKSCYKSYGQQGVNECFATMLHSRQDKAPDYVSYTTIKNPDDYGLITSCESFITPGIEFVPAGEISYSVKGINTESPYDRFIRVCTENGLSEDTARNYIDYQTLTDFVLTNTDRHYSNFGILRDINTFKFVKPAPIFDSGNCMFYNTPVGSPLTKVDILGMTITSIYDREERMLKRVQNKHIVDVMSLPSKDETIELYTSFGIPENKAVFIADGYQKKIEMLNEFQRGKTISLYLEKHKHQDCQPEEEPEEEYDI